MSRSAWGVLVATLFAIATWVTLIPEQWRKPLVLVTWIALLLSSIGWLMAHSQRLRRKRAETKATHPMTLLVIGLAGASLAIITWLLVPKELLAPPSETEPQLSPSQVVTLYRLFKEDVPGVKSIDFTPVTLHMQPSGATFGVEPRFHVDFVSLSKFVSFYIPSSSAAQDIIRFVADNYSTLTGIDVIELTLTKPGEYPRSTEAIKFTGSIVIYHEDALSNADLASLEEYYQQHQLTPVWRGTGICTDAGLTQKKTRSLGAVIQGSRKDAIADRPVAIDYRAYRWC